VVRDSWLVRLAGRHGRYAAAVVVVVCLSFASGCAHATKARPHSAASQNPTTALTVQRGEIELDGVVVSIDTKNRSLVLEARNATLPGGKPAAISPTPKTVTIGPLAMISRGGEAARRLDLSALKAGETVSVIGKNLGVGKPLPARLVITKTQAAMNRSPAKTGQSSQQQRLQSQHIEVTPSAWQHIMDRHTVGGARSAGTSIFNPGEDIRALIKKAELITPVREENGYLKREFDAGHIIGTDPATGKQTSRCRVIATQSGKLVTAYPVAP